MARFPVLRVMLFLLSVLFLVPGVFRPGGIYDEGLILVGADRILLGEVPYRDFWNTHTPGQISVVAAIFRLFGPSMMIARAYDVLVRAGLAVACFALAGRLSTRAGALIAWAAATVYLGQFSNFGYATYPSLLCALIGILPLLTVKDRRDLAAGPRRCRLALGGAGAGCSVLFRHDLGFTAAIAGLVLLWFDVAADRGEPGRLPERLRRRIGETLWYLAGLGALTLPVAGVFLSVGTPWLRVRQIFFDYPVLVYARFRALPLPSATLERLTLALPAVAVVAGVLRGMFGACPAAEDRRRSYPMVALGLLGVLAFPQAFTRSDIPHQLPVLLPTIALFPGLLAPPTGSRTRWTVFLRLLGAAALVLMLRLPLLAYVGSIMNLSDRGTIATTHGLERARLIPLSAFQVDAVKAVQRLSREGDYLYVGLGRHDKAFSNDALFYFLAGRRCATYYHNLLPGLVTSAPVQREILADLERRQVKLLVLFTDNDAVAEPNQSRFTSRVRILDQGIRQGYARSLLIGPYEIWERK